MKNYFAYLAFVILVGSSPAQAAVFALVGHWQGQGVAYDPSGKEMFTYEVSEDNTAASFSETDSHVTMTLEDGTKTEFDLTYSDTSLYDSEITSDYGSGQGSCSSVWGPCTSEFGSASHSFETTLYIDGMNSGHMVKKEYLQGRLAVVYREAYERSLF